LAVSRDGKTVFAALPAQDLVRFLAIPVDGGGPVTTMFTTSDPAWSMDASIYLDQVSRPVHLIRISSAGHAEAFATVRIPEHWFVSHSFAILPDGRAVVPDTGAGQLILMDQGKDEWPS
jgi:hypothetical protein